MKDTRPERAPAGSLGRWSETAGPALIFIEVGLDPDPGQVGDGEEVHAGAHLHALEDLLAGDVAGGGRVEGHGALGLAVAVELVDQAVRHVEQLEAAAGGGQEILAAAAHLGELRARESLGGLAGAQVLLLAGEQLGRVDREQRLAAAHGLAGGEDVELLDPARGLGVDVADARLVGRDQAHRAGGAG
jgi:hypothetical protein